MRIPVITATQSGAQLPPHPKEACHPIRPKAAPHRSAVTPGLIGLRGGNVGFHERLTLTHCISSERNLVRIMEQPVKDRVRQSWIPSGPTLSICALILLNCHLI